MAKNGSGLVSWLVCFAVREEAAALPRRLRNSARVRLLITGIGARNAAKSVSDALAQGRPEGVLSAGFAGALDPGLSIGDLLWEGEVDEGMRVRLKAAGVREGRFCASVRVLGTQGEKQELRRITGADAVEMESAAIREVCEGAGVECLTLRAISDLANEDLPVDFNRYLSEDGRLQRGRMAFSILRSPRRLAGLFRMQRNSRVAARVLGVALARLVDPVEV